MKQYIIKFFSWAKGFFEEGSVQSSKRLAGLSCIGVGLILTALDGLKFFEINHENLYIIMGTGALALGFSSVTRKLSGGEK